MGIFGLSGFVFKNNRNRFLETLELKKGSSLVFDGNSYFNRTNVPKRYGGDYASLYAHYEHDFKTLQLMGITAYVILDGQRVVNTIKNQLTQKGRQRFLNCVKKLDHDTKDRGSYPKPIFLRNVFLQVLQDMKIPHAVSDNAADTAVAAVAKKLGCPVLSEDSDFLILNLDHGVIRVSDLKQSLKENTDCDVYYFRKMESYLEIDPTLMPFVSVILGNDYSSENRYNVKIQKSINAYEASCFGERLQLCPVNSWYDRCNLELFKDEAVVLCSLLNDTATPQEKLQRVYNTSNGQIEEVVKGLYQNGLVCASISDVYFSDIHFNAVQCENVNMEPSCQASEKLRNYMYALLKYEHLCKTETVVITKYRRDGDSYNDYNKKVETIDWTDIPIDVLFRQSSSEEEEKDTNTLEKRLEKNKEILLQLVQYPHENLKEVPQEHELFMLSLHYVILQQQERREKNIKWLHVKALLICYLNSYYSTAAAESSHLMVDIDASHAFAEWQSCLYYLDIINTLFFRPFQSLNYSAVFNGSSAHTIFKNLEKDNDEELVTDASKEMYANLENKFESPMKRKVCIKRISSQKMHSMYIIIMLKKKCMNHYTTQIVVGSLLDKYISYTPGHTLIMQQNVNKYGYFRNLRLSELEHRIYFSIVKKVERAAPLWMPKSKANYYSFLIEVSIATFSVAKFGEKRGDVRFEKACVSHETLTHLGCISWTC
ncbi:protein asteroid homolog 1-like [Hydractinia symbiolongicarpus]|uniref:protein asteroid homolog 1-like n=1 Tax=Hydractinia symbiolongicarpus TaxID=13093 RepID=UPI00254C1EFF|nr:protein asteroid homolog 1-like [Hydractinia symbiolongicarpus]